MDKKKIYADFKKGLEERNYQADFLVFQVLNQVLNISQLESDKIQTIVDKKKKVLDLIHNYGTIDGGHHKQWLLDQIVRVLVGEGYDKWVREYQEGEDGANTYSWDEGTAP